jgi:hypothetical protein
MNMNAQDLKTHQWENRIIIIKTTTITSEKYQAQHKEFEGEQKALQDRKFIIYTIIGDNFELINYTNSKRNTSGKIIGKLAKIIDNKENFEVLLIGLDGGVKLQQTTILTKEELFKLVDSMPMRQSELRRTKN